MKFEEFLKTAEAFSAEKARNIAVEIAETTKIATFQEIVKMPEFCDFIDIIKEAALVGNTNVYIHPVPIEKIESYTMEHKLVPEELLNFSDRQRKAFSALKDLGYIVSIGVEKCYADGMNQMCDAPLECESARVYWGVNQLLSHALG